MTCFAPTAAYTPTNSCRTIASSLGIVCLRKAVDYEELCAAPLGNPRDDRQYEQKVAGLCALGLRTVSEPAAVAAAVARALPTCAPNRNFAPLSATLMQHVLGDTIEHDMRKLYAFLVHQSDDNNVLVANLTATSALTASAAVQARLHTVDRVLQTPVAPELHVRIVTEVLLSIAILRAMQITDVHQFPRHIATRYRCAFSMANFDNDCSVRSPWPPHALITAKQLVAELVTRVPQLKAEYRVYQDLRSGAHILRSIVNNVLGCELIGKRGRVQADHLHYKAALMASGAQART